MKRYQPPCRPQLSGQKADAPGALIEDPLIDPPFPAPYLREFEPLPGDLLAKFWAGLLTKADKRRLRLMLNSLFRGKTARIRVAREQWEKANGVLIRPRTRVGAMITAETRANAARLFHQASDLLAAETLRVPAGDLVKLIEALWSETERADLAEGQIRAATADARMDELFGPSLFGPRSR